MIVATLDPKLVARVRGFRVVFVCGPPGVGKDSFCDSLMAVSDDPAGGPFAKHKMTALMDRMLRQMFSSDEEFRYWREEAKDKPCPHLGRKTMRSALQSLSEEWLKPMCGKDVFGMNLLLSTWVWLHTSGGTLLVSDSGFLEEAEPFIHRYGVGNCLQIRVHRDGKTFAGDTRGWWEYVGLETLDVFNEPNAPFAQWAAVD